MAAYSELGAILRDADLRPAPQDEVYLVIGRRDTAKKQRYIENLSFPRGRRLVAIDHPSGRADGAGNAASELLAAYRVELQLGGLDLLDKGRVFHRVVKRLAQGGNYRRRHAGGCGERLAHLRRGRHERG